MARAQKINAGFGLTGFLHHEDGFFFQWLEGPPEALELVCARLERDTRHFNMTYLSRGMQDVRHFDGWTMGYSMQDGGSILAWLADHSVALREKLAYSAAVLSFMQHRRAMS